MVGGQLRNVKNIFCHIYNIVSASGSICWDGEDLEEK